VKIFPRGRHSVSLIAIKMEAVRIFPRQFNETFTVSTPFKNGFTIVVSRPNGKTIFLRSFPDKDANVNLREFPAGIYKLKVIGQGHIVEEKLQKI
jgi:hypothetical protein